jgi:hypothetical protein
MILLALDLCSRDLGVDSLKRPGILLDSPFFPHLYSRLLNLVWYYGVYVNNCLQQIVHDFRPGLLSYLLDLLQLTLSVFFCLCFGFLVA